MFFKTYFKRLYFQNNNLIKIWTLILLIVLIIFKQLIEKIYLKKTLINNHYNRLHFIVKCTLSYQIFIQLFIYFVLFYTLKFFFCILQNEYKIMDLNIFKNKKHLTNEDRIEKKQSIPRK